MSLVLRPGRARRPAGEQSVRLRPGSIPSGLCGVTPEASDGDRNRPQSRRNPDLTPDPIAEALVPDPIQGPANAAVLQGYLGRGATPGTWRVYFTPSLDSYVEVNESDILHTGQLPDDQGKLVWVNRSATLQHVQVHSQQAQAEFLGGAITSAHLAAAAAAPAAPAPGAPPLPVSLTPICPTLPAVCFHSQIVLCHPSIGTICPTPTLACHTIVNCPSVTTLCPSLQTPCASQQIICRSVQAPCVSLSLQCQSITTLCPTHQLHCQTLATCPTQRVLCQPSIPCPSLQGCPSLKAALAANTANYSLCHGIAGNAETLLYAREILGPEYQADADQAYAAGEAGISAYARRGVAWPCGTHEGETPNLLLGLAGIGYFYLRLFDPTIPSVLVLRPERIRQSLAHRRS